MEIKNHQVHVWQTDVCNSTVYPKDIQKVLSPVELERVNKFRVPKDQAHFIFRHYKLRVILSLYCGCQPQNLIFRYNSFGKPFIDMPEFNEVRFNMSFSGNLMILGISRQNNIGCDIEEVREIDDQRNIANENFSTQEIQILNHSNDEIGTFFKIWTRKEALIKAIGKGMFYPLKSFTVNMDPLGGPEHLLIIDNTDESKLWRTTPLNISDGYIASLAIESDEFQISYFKQSDKF